MASQDYNKDREVLNSQELLRMGNFLREAVPDNAEELLERLKKSASQLDDIVSDICGLPEMDNFTYDGNFFDNGTHHIQIQDGLHFLQDVNNSVLEEALKNTGPNGLVKFIIRICEEDVTEALTQLANLSINGQLDKLIPNQEKLN